VKGTIKLDGAISPTQPVFIAFVDIIKLGD